MPNCTILACQYSTTLIPIVNALGILFFLPVIAYLVIISGVSAPDPTIVGVLLLASIPYFFALCYGIAVGIDKLRRKSTKGKLSKKEALAPFGNIGAFSLIIALFNFTALTFLAYPTVQLPLDYMNFVEVASLIVLIVTLYSMKGVGLTKNQNAYRAYLGVAPVSILVLILGAFTSFIYDVRVTSTPPTEVDLASIEALRVGSMGGCPFNRIHSKHDTRVYTH
jgi:hypothetical protein